MKTYDVIVIGAGNGGLAAATKCAQAGLSTLLLERHNLPGGAASSFVRGRFEFEPSLHELSGVGAPDETGSIDEDDSYVFYYNGGNGYQTRIDSGQWSDEAEVSKMPIVSVWLFLQKRVTRIHSSMRTAWR